mmetsp:Transcript_4298/g.18269  ORF Transcript_4298/g.18269 Transcript_4298/m.18269 type:complete len:297 (-) Transcript_4298:221-1111(-)
MRSSYLQGRICRARPVNTSDYLTRPSSRILTSTTRSPGSPAWPMTPSTESCRRNPALPAPRTVTVSPLAAPRRTGTCAVFFASTRPNPKHLGHSLSSFIVQCPSFSPHPPHRGQLASTVTSSAKTATSDASRDASNAVSNISRVNSSVASLSSPRPSFLDAIVAFRNLRVSASASADAFFSSSRRAASFFFLAAIASSAFSAAAYARADASTASAPRTSPASSSSASRASSRLHFSSSSDSEPIGTSSRRASSAARLPSSVSTSCARLSASNASGVPPRSGCASLAFCRNASRTAR